MIEFLITSSLLIVIITAIRYIFKGKISLKMQYALWLIVAIRLLIPVQPVSSSLSVLNFIPTPRNEVREEMLEVRVPSALLDDIDKDVFRPVEEWTVFGTKNSEGEKILYPPLKLFNTEMILYSIWYIGIAVSLTAVVVSNIHFIRKLRKSRILLDTNTKLKFYICGMIPTPCLYGIIKPSVYMTPDHSEQEYRCIAAHETVHYRHKDHLWSLLRMLCVCIHWYNPLVWMAASLSKRDGELACDESTIKILGEESRIDYGRVLIGMTSSKPTSFSMLSGATTMVTGKRGMQERISLIAKKPKIITAAVVLMILIIVIASACTFTGKKFDEHKNETYTVVLNGGSSVTVTDDDGFSRSYGGFTKDEIVSYLNGEIIIKNADNKLSHSLILMDSNGEIAAMRDGMDADGKKAINELIDEYNLSTERLDPIEHSTLKEFYKVTRYLGKNNEVEFYYAYIDPSNGNAVMESESDGSMAYVPGTAYEAVKSLLDSAELYIDPEEYKLGNAVREAILENDIPRHGRSEFSTAAYQVLGEEHSDDSLTLYMQVLYQGYDYIDGAMVSVSGSSYPAAITLDIDRLNGEYILNEYWEPLLGADYYPSIKKKFPSELVSMTDDGRLVKKNQQVCDDDAAWYLENRESEEELFDEMVRTKDEPKPMWSSQMSASSILRGRENATLRYIYKECLKGGQTDERSKYMYKMLCDILGNEQIKLETETLQEYFDAFLAHAEREFSSMGADDMEKFYPKMFMLLEMTGKID